MAFVQLDFGSVFGVPAQIQTENLTETKEALGVFTGDLAPLAFKML